MLASTALAGYGREMSNPAVLKRQKERERQERQKEKAARKEERKREKETRPRADGEDPDIAGIVPGPQPPIEDQGA